jgi:excisionase family DNA binding protein
VPPVASLRSLSPSPPKAEPLAVSPAEAARLAGLGRTTIYAALGSGALKSLKIGKRRLIALDALRSWLLSHPPSEQDINGVLAAVHGIRANDEIEAMLAVQMVATHFAATRALRRLKGSDMVSQQDSNGNLAVKLLRTFAAQTEALQRYRGKGQQKVTVEHVHIQ